ncbi:MAG TPA: MmcQ/YjbR family DNA-binding protein [bacterium]|nr:MmcQ/YjbR family DNA-binding protein [bacterium]
MELERLRDHLKQKPGATEEIPFGPGVLVYKVRNKMFALLAWEEDPLRINLKCDPEHAEGLRAIYPAVLPGYHMNKRHWNSVVLDGSIPPDVLEEMIADSYSLVARGPRGSGRKRPG